VIETLTDDSQILLLYLADELPPEDRQAIERRLESDPALAFSLDQLRSTYLEIEEGLAELDKHSGLPVTADAAARMVGREIRKRMATPRVVAPTAPARGGWRIRPFVIPGAVAASILVAGLVWINHGPTLDKPGVLPAPTQYVHADDVDLFRGSFTPPVAELADVLGSASARKDAAPQDDVSQYLLNVETAQD
jgi:hypothetical protein